jgi:hypothetical protein
MTKKKTTKPKVTRSVARNVPGPVAASCTITHCQYFTLQKALRAVKHDNDDSDQVRERLSKLLNDAAIALNGPEPPLTKWSFHDVPEKIVALQAKLHSLIEATDFYLVRAGQHMSEMQNQELIQALEEAKKQ